MSKERNVLAQIIKSWAQEHHTGFIISAPEDGDVGVENTGAYFSWLIKHENVDANFLSLLNKLESYALNIKGKKYPDGMFCVNCGQFYQYAEPNQLDGSLVCWACRQPH